MDYEKKYKEALEMATKLHSETEYVCEMEMLEQIFPELKESEDERIRKALINVFSTHQGYEVFFGVSVEDILAWLEKQGKTSWKPSKEEMDVLYGLSYITNEFDEQKEEVITRLYQDLKREFFNGTSFENMFPTNTSTELEKQGEQEPADKVEPEFKLEKGKWYVCNKSRYKDFVIGKAYYCPKDGMLKPNENEMARYVARDCFHLWTIQDAKELKKIEQKHAWSEEDEGILKGIIWEIEANKSYAPDYDIATYDRFLSWLKSI